MQNISKRDHFLDFLKGVAILSVVFGHTFQSIQANFDDLYGFRFIYSFHMPFFVFLSGAAASYWVASFDTSLTTGRVLTTVWDRVYRSFNTLIIPFFCWSLISYWFNHRDENLIIYIEQVLMHPDISLWFLPCIFWCILYVTLFFLFISIARNLVGTSKYHLIRTFFDSKDALLIFLIVVWIFIKSKLPSVLGLVFANQFHNGLFLFFVLGIMTYARILRIKSSFFWGGAYITFLSLVYFWHRTLPLNLMMNAPEILKVSIISKWYSLVVALAGILVFIDLSKRVYELDLLLLNKVFCYMGSFSLGIYAIHFYFLGYSPAVVSPILISLLISQIIMILPGVRYFLLAKRV